MLTLDCTETMECVGPPPNPHTTQTLLQASHRHKPHIGHKKACQPKQISLLLPARVPNPHTGRRRCNKKTCQTKQLVRRKQRASEYLQLMSQTRTYPVCLFYARSHQSVSTVSMSPAPWYQEQTGHALCMASTSHAPSHSPWVPTPCVHGPPPPCTGRKTATQR